MSYRYKESTSCPFCGSTNIVLTDHHYAEKAFDKAVSAGIAHLLGLGHHGTIAGDEYDKPYLCKNCGRTWVGNGYNPEGLPEDQYLYEKYLPKFLQRKYKFSSIDKVRDFFDELNSNIYSFEGNYVETPIIRSHYHLLKAYACLAFCVTEIKSNRVHILHIDSMISNGLDETIRAYQHQATGEIELCNNLLRHLSCSVYGNETDIDLSYSYQKDSYVLPRSYWDEMILFVKNFDSCDFIEPSSAYALIDFFLTQDLRTDFWASNSATYDRYHISTKSNYYDKKELAKEFSIFKSNFNIPASEKIIFVRDTSFWNNRNQGLVITNENFYYIEDNENPTIVRYPWGCLKNIAFRKDSWEMELEAKDGSVLRLDCGLFIYGKDMDDDGPILNFLISLEELFNDIVSWLN